MLRELAFVLMMVVSADLPFQVIVHRSNPATSITRAELSAIYLKRLRSWPRDKEIVPVDQPAKSRLREQFSRSIHGKSVAYVTRYWQRLIFAGRGVPPHETATVIDFVKANPGAIGYVERGTPLDDGVKAITVTK